MPAKRPLTSTIYKAVKIPIGVDNMVAKVTIYAVPITAWINPPSVSGD